MKLIVRLAIVTSLVAMSQNPKVHADDSGRLAIVQMCKREPLIIEGKWLGNDRVAVSKVWQTGHRGYRKDDEPVLNVNYHMQLNLKIKLAKGGSKGLIPKNVTMFLEFDEHAQPW